MPTVITATQVVTDFGAFYIDSGQNEGNIHTRLMESFGTRDAFQVVETEDTVLRETNAAFTEVLQSFQKVFTPKGGVAFTPKAISLYNVKVDEAFYPDDLKNSWVAFLTSNKLDRTEWPFVRWFIESYVLQQINVDIETKAIYKGVYAAPTPGTPNNAVDVINGIKKIINDAITAAAITVIPTGAPNADPVLWTGQVEAFVKSIPEVYWGQALTLNMSRSLALRYEQGRRIKYNMYYPQVAGMSGVQDFENITIAGRASHAGENKIWMTPKANAVLALKGGSNKDIVETEKVDRMVKVYTDFWMGLGFIDDSLVWTNDQNLV